MVWAILGGFLSYIVNFFLTPFIVNRVGIEQYGFVSLGNTIISYINIIAVAINSFSARFIAVHYHKKEFKEASSMYSSILIANIILAVIVMIISIPLLLNLEILLNIPQNIEFDIKLLFLFVLFNYLINLFNSVINTIIFINNQTDITSKIKGFSA